jgi:hypothetical protein
MHGDFSLNPLAHRHNVSRVLYQMGRVQLESDSNEQTESILHYLRGLAADVIGNAGGPKNSFEVRVKGDLFTVNWGTYYVDGIRCVNTPPGDRWEQITTADPSPPLVTDLYESFWDPKTTLPPLKEPQLIYLAAWERHVSSTEDDRLREKALQGPDTASRAVIVWQIRMTPAKPVRELADQIDKIEDNLRAYYALNAFLRSGARMSARARWKQTSDPCTISPEARYRGAENRLYRIEIHEGGDDDAKTAARPSFKWSPDNGAIVYPVRDVDGSTVVLESLGRDDRTAINIGDWVELVDDRGTLTHTPGALRQVIHIERQSMTLTLDGDAMITEDKTRAIRPILRRWASDAIPLRTGKDPDDGWYELSDGVEVRFATVPLPRARFRSGDYWLVPTRTATGDVLWPTNPKTEDALDVPPHGIDEHYAPLAVWDPSAVEKDRMAPRRGTWLPLVEMPNK